MGRIYWIVEFTAAIKPTFLYCDTETEAMSVVADYTRAKIPAIYWKL